MRMVVASTIVILFVCVFLNPIYHNSNVELDVNNSQRKDGIDTLSVRADSEDPTLDADNSPNAGTTGDNFMFDVTILDNIDVDEVWANWSHGVLKGNLSLTDNGDETWSGTITLDLMSVEDLTYFIWFNDTSDNWNITAIQYVEVSDNDVPWFLGDINTTGTPTTGDAYIFNVSVADNINIDEVYLNYSYDDQLYTPVLMTKLTGAWWNYQKQITVDPGATDICYRFDILDIAGNWHNETRTQKAVTDNDAPVWQDSTYRTPEAGEFFTLSIIATDNVATRAILSVTAHYSYNYMSFSSGPMTKTPGTDFYNLTILAPVNASTFRYYFEVDDGSGNVVDTYEDTVEGQDPFVVIDTQVPVIHAGFNTTIDQHENMTFNATVSFDNVGIFNYTWTFTYGGLKQEIYGVVVNFKFDIAGVYLVWLNITDAQGNWNTTNISVTVRDSTDPIGVPRADATTVDQGDVVTFNASASSDNIGIENYTWTLDGEDKYGMEVNFTFLGVGTFLVFLTVTDAAGNYNETNLTITVKDTTLPTADAGNDVEKTMGTTLFFDGSGSSDNVGILTYTWSFMYDGKMESLSGETGVDYYFTVPGIYKVTLMVTDAAGNRAEDWMIVTILDNIAPIARATIGGTPIADGDTHKIEDIAPKEGKKLLLDAHGSTDNVGIVNWTWTITGPGVDVRGYGDTFSYMITKEGTYTVILEVSDGARNDDALTFIIQINWLGEPEKGGSIEESDDIFSLIKENLMFTLGFITLFILIVVIVSFQVIKKKKPLSEEEEKDREKQGDEEKNDKNMEEEVLAVECPECGSKLINTDMECPHCGAWIEDKEDIEGENFMDIETDLVSENINVDEEENIQNGSIYNENNTIAESMPIKMERSVSDTKFGEKGMEFEGHSQTDPELMEPRKESYKKGRILSEMPADKQPNSEGNEENELIEQVYRMHSVEEKNPREIAKALNVSAREVRDIIYMHSKSGM